LFSDAAASHIALEVGKFVDDSLGLVVVLDLISRCANITRGWKIHLVLKVISCLE
jgi:hypothetical protein